MPHTYNYPNSEPLYSFKKETARVIDNIAHSDYLHRMLIFLAYCVLFAVIAFAVYEIYVYKSAFQNYEYNYDRYVARRKLSATFSLIFIFILGCYFLYK
jgi:hypothetical protein